MTFILPNATIDQEEHKRLTWIC